MRQRSGTTLTALPPLIRPMLAVVCSSMRPSFMAAIAAAAAAIALRPVSGAMPAWAATPWKSAASIFCEGARVTTSPTGPALSSTKPARASSPARSSALAPRSPISSQVEKTAVRLQGGGDDARSASRASRAVQAALSSAPRIVSPALRTTPPSTTAVIGPSTATVSMWAAIKRGVPRPSPGTCTVMFPLSEPVSGPLSSSVGSRPRSRR